MTIVTKCKQTTTKSATHCLKTWFSGWRSWPAVDPKCHATVYVVLTGKETVKSRWFISPFTNTNPSSGVSLFSYFVIENKQIVVLETTESPQGPLVFCEHTNNHLNNNVTINQDVFVARSWRYKSLKANLPTLPSFKLFSLVFLVGNTSC